MNIGIILYVYSVWFAYPDVSSIFSCHPVVYGPTLYPVKPAAVMSAVMKFFPLRDCQMRAHRSVRVASHKKCTPPRRVHRV